MKLTYILFIILTGMVTILFAGVTLKKNTVENPYKCALGLEDHKPFLEKANTYAFDGEFEHPVGKVTHNIPLTFQPLVKTKLTAGKGLKLSQDKGMITISKDDSYYNDIVKGDRYDPFVGEPVDTLPKQSYIQFNGTGTSIYSNGVEVALRRKNGTWKVIDSRKAMEVMYQNIYTRDSVRRSK